VVEGKYLISDIDSDSPVSGVFGLCETDQLSGTSLIQTFRSLNANPQSFMRRSVDSGASWGGWNGGSRVANANGTAFKMADGTMTCISNGLSSPATSTADGSGFRGATQSWNFPFTFVGATPVIYGASEDIDGWISFGSPSTTAVTFRTRRFTTLATAVNVNLMAYGRWY
jgi:hypothetical protein